MHILTGTATLPFLLLIMTLFLQTSCQQAAYVSDKINQTMAANSGVLTAAPGTRLADLRQQSTLDIGAGTGSLSKESKHRFFIQSKRFDWQLPNSSLAFKDCSSYAISTDNETGEIVTDMQIGTAQRYYTWAEVKAEMLNIEQRLLADGWKPTFWKGQPSSDRLHKELENPNFFNQLSDRMADAGYEKGDLQFVFAAKRARGEGKPNVADGQNFLHYVLVNDMAYEAKRDQQLEEDQRIIDEQLRQKEAEQSQKQTLNR